MVIYQRFKTELRKVSFGDLMEAVNIQFAGALLALWWVDGARMPASKKQNKRRRSESSLTVNREESSSIRLVG